MFFINFARPTVSFSEFRCYFVRIFRWIVLNLVDIFSELRLILHASSVETNNKFNLFVWERFKDRNDAIKNLQTDNLC